MTKLSAIVFLAFTAVIAALMVTVNRVVVSVLSSTETCKLMFLLYL